MSYYDMLIRTLIDTAESSITKDVDQSIDAVCKVYYDIQNSYLKEAERRLELLIFKLYDYQYFCSDKDHVDIVRFVTDDEYYQQCQNKQAANLGIHQGALWYDEATKLVAANDLASAGNLFYKAALCGHADAQFNYGVTLARGEGRSSNRLESCYWYWKSSVNNNAKAMVNLAIAYRNGEGVKADAGQMLYLYVAASELLLPEAVFYTGLSLKDEEVFADLVEIGNAMILYSQNLNNEAVAEKVKALSSKLKNLIEDNIPLLQI